MALVSHRSAWSGSLLFSFVVLLLCVFVQAQDCSQSKPCATGCCSKFGYCGTGPDFCGAGNCVANCDFKLGCDANNPCQSGCCSKFGFCGLGPDYCSPENCVAGCNSKAYCDPGGYGKYAEISTCPLNVCCSKWGFCGITPEFCGTKKVQRPSSANCPNHGLTRVVGYYESWSADRSCNKFVPERIPLGVYTHLNYAFATVDPRTFEVRPAVAADKEMMLRLTALKKADPGLKVFIAIGGWTFNDPGPTATTFSDIARNIGAQQAFIKSLIKFLQDYNFDGVDIDWEYPRATDRNGRPEDFANFPTFIANLKSALKTTGGRDGLSITLPVSYWYLQHFDIKKLVQNVDFFNMMSYDLHGTWDANSKWLGNYLNAHTNLTEIKEAMDLLWRNDISPSKVVLGTAFYGRAFTASTAGCTSPGCTFSSGARAGPCSDEVSVLLNSEIVDLQTSKGISPVWDKAAAVKIQTFDGNQWVAYDDADTLKQKVDFAKSQCMSGVMVWAVSHDTSDGRFSKALGQSTGLKMAPIVPSALPLNTQIKNNHNQCKWTGCQESCPSGWVRMMRDDKWKKRDPEPMRDNTGCDDLDPPREFCCPPESVPSGCGWYSHNGNGKCKAGCPADYVEVGSMTVACKSGAQSACCKKGADSLKLYEQCTWNCGKNTVCSNTEVASSNLGSGGQTCKIWEAPATVMQTEIQYPQKYCCSQSDTAQWSDCDWYSMGIYKNTQSHQGGYCPGGCPDGKYRVALDENSSRCPAGGRLARCCNANYFDLVKRSNPQAGAWEAAMRYWIDNNMCYDDRDFWKRDLVFGNVSNLNARTSNVNFLSPRADDEKIKQFEMMYQIVAILYNNYAAGEDIKNLWENIVVAKFPGLTADNLSKIINRQINLLGWGLDITIRDILCRMQYFGNTMSQSNQPRGCICTRQDCCAENDYQCQGDNDDYTKRSMLEITDGTNLTSVSHHFSLQKRGKRKDYKIDWVGVASWIVWARSYRSPSAIPQGDPVRALAYQRPTTNDCTVTDPERTNAVPRVHEAEHVIERQTVLSHFFTDMGTGTLPGGQRPQRLLRRFSVGFMNFLVGTNLVQAPPARGNPSNSQTYDNSRPMDRIANALGSVDNRDPFTMLMKALNMLKGQLLGRGDGARMWGTARIDELLNAATYTDGATELQNGILAMQYHNEREVNARLIQTANDVRGELQLAETQYNAVVQGDQQQATIWWDYWIRAEYENTRVRFLTQFTDLYTRLRSRFGNDPIAVRDLDRLYNIALGTAVDLTGLIYPLGGLP